MMNTTPWAVYSMRLRPGWASRGVPTFLGCIHFFRCLRVWLSSSIAVLIST